MTPLLFAATTTAFASMSARAFMRPSARKFGARLGLPAGATFGHMHFFLKGSVESWRPRPISSYRPHQIIIVFVVLCSATTCYMASASRGGAADQATHEYLSSSPPSPPQTFFYKPFLVLQTCLANETALRRTPRTCAHRCSPSCEFHESYHGSWSGEIAAGPAGDTRRHKTPP